MRLVISAAAMKAADIKTIEEKGVPQAVLMERAALAVCGCLEDLSSSQAGVLVICGPGNNGGDGFAVARILRERGYAPDVWFLGDRERCSKGCRLQMEIYEKTGGSFYLDGAKRMLII